MMRKLFGVISGLILLMPLVALGDANVTDKQTPEKVVADFQKLPHHELFCKKNDWYEWDRINVGAKYKAALSKQFYELVMWSQCIVPLNPDSSMDYDRNFYWDIRYGLGNLLLGDPELNFAKNHRVQVAKLLGGTKAKVDLIFDVPAVGVKNIRTTYTLIREEGKWKIDDIAPHGDYEEDSEREPALEHSDSIKADMQKNYRAAEKRYQDEQTKKH